jgi:hypothetical protein
MTAGPELRGQRVVLRLVIAEHVPDLRRILGTPEVRCAGVMRPRPRSGPLTTCPPPGSPSCSTDRSAEWCSTARRRSRRTGTRRSTSFSIRLSTGRVSAATPFSPWSATSCVSLTDPRDDRYRGWAMVEALFWRLVALSACLADLPRCPRILGPCSLSGSQLAVLAVHVACQPWMAGPHDWGSCASCRRSYTARYRPSAIPCSPGRNRE